MKTRLFFRFFSVLLVLSAFSLTTNGCKDTLQDPPTPAEFGAIRVINMTDCSGGPVDVYIHQAGTVEDTIPQVPGLKFGVPSAYTTNLPATVGGTQYELRVTPVNDRIADLIPAHPVISLTPKAKSSVILFTENGIWSALQVPDAPGSVTPDTTSVFVRFIHTEAETGNVTVKIDDPVNGATLVSNVPFKSVSDYVKLPFPGDAGFTFFILSGDGSSGDILGRLAGVAFAKGSYHTLTYAGNICGPSVPQGNPIDSFRVRVFDDNEEGVEMTNPIPLTLRYSFINALIPSDDVPYSLLGISINNDQNPKKKGFTFPDVSPFMGVPASGDEDGIPKLSYASAILTDAINIKGFRTDNIEGGGRGGELLFDYRAGKRSDIVSDLPVVFIISDTVITKPNTVRDSSTVNAVAVPIPDQALKDQARIIIVHAMGRHRNLTSLTGAFSINGEALSTFTNKRPPTYDTSYVMPASPDGSDVNVKADMKAGGPFQAETYERNFKVRAGGIYIAVLVGWRGATNPDYKPHWYIARLN